MMIETSVCYTNGTNCQPKLVIFMRAHQERKVGAKHHLNILRLKFDNYIAIQHSVDVLLRSHINVFEVRRFSGLTCNFSEKF